MYGFALESPAEVLLRAISFHMAATQLHPPRSTEQSICVCQPLHTPVHHSQHSTTCVHSLSFSSSLFSLTSIIMSGPAKRMSMKQAAEAQRSFSLRLYRALLRSHRAVLPVVMRDLGDSYVREEFKRHKSAQPQHLNAFFREWLGYLTQMNSQGQGSYGAHLPEEYLSTLSTEQKQMIDQLRKETQRAAEVTLRQQQANTARILQSDVAVGGEGSRVKLGMEAIDGGGDGRKEEAVPGVGRLVGGLTVRKTGGGT